MYRHFCYSCPEDQKVCRCKTVVSTTYRPNLDKCRPVRRRSSLLTSCLRVYCLFLRFSCATTTSNAKVECHQQVLVCSYHHIQIESKGMPPLLWPSVKLCVPLLYYFRPRREGWRRGLAQAMSSTLRRFVRMDTSFKYRGLMQICGLSTRSCRRRTRTSNYSRAGLFSGTALISISKAVRTSAFSSMRRLPKQLFGSLCSTPMMPTK